MKSIRHLAIIQAVILATMLGGAATAQRVEPSDIVNATLREGWRTESGTHMAALQLRLDDGWKTYWRVPGVAGIPPTFEWGGSRNIASVDLHWPRPEVFDQGGIRTVGYRGGVVLPIEVTPADPARPVTIRARVNLGICRDICIPVDLALRGTLRAQDGGDDVIAGALSRLPKSSREADVREHVCDVAATEDGIAVTARVRMPPLAGREVAVMEYTVDGMWASEATTRRDGAWLTTRATVSDSSGASAGLDRSAVRLTILGAGDAVELRGCPAAR